MKTLTKATLLNAFVIPGTGHCLLKRFKSGILFLSLAILTSAYIFVHIISIAQNIISKINISGSVIDIQSIQQQVEQSLYHSESSLLNWAIWLFIATWIFSLIDLFRLRSHSSLKKNI